LPPESGKAEKWHAKALLQGVQNISKPLNQPNIEIDLLHTFIGNRQNQFWIAYALNLTTGGVLDFIVERRNSGP